MRKTISFKRKTTRPLCCLKEGQNRCHSRSRRVFDIFQFQFHSMLAHIRSHNLFVSAPLFVLGGLDNICNVGSCCPWVITTNVLLLLGTWNLTGFWGASDIVAKRKYLRAFCCKGLLTSISTLCMEFSCTKGLSSSNSHGRSL